WDFLERFTDVPHELAEQVRNKTPEWASRVTGCDVATIEEFARLVGATKRAYFRLGYGFARSRNGVVNMHAACCIPTVTGAWRRLPQQRGHLSLEQVDDRRLRRPRSGRPDARSVAHRADPVRRR